MAGHRGVTQRSRDVIDQLGPQDGTYSVLVRDGSHSHLEVVDVVRELLFAAEQPDELHPTARRAVHTRGHAGRSPRRATATTAPLPARRRRPSSVSWYGAWQARRRR